jgi:hypothetical protein
MNPEPAASPSHNARSGARVALLLALALVSLAVLTGPPSWGRVLQGLLGLLGAAWCIVTIKVDRLRGATLGTLAEDFRTGRRKPHSRWADVAFILVFGATLVLLLRGH